MLDYTFSRSFVSGLNEKSTATTSVFEFRHSRMGSQRELWFECEKLMCTQDHSVDEGVVRIQYEINKANLLHTTILTSLRDGHRPVFSNPPPFHFALRPRVA